MTAAHAIQWGCAALCTLLALRSYAIEAQAPSTRLTVASLVSALLAAASIAIALS